MQRHLIAQDLGFHGPPLAIGSAPFEASERDLQGLQASRGIRKADGHGVQLAHALDGLRTGTHLLLPTVEIHQGHTSQALTYLKFVLGVNVAWITEVQGGHQARARQCQDGTLRLAQRACFTFVAAVAKRRDLHRVEGQLFAEESAPVLHKRREELGVLRCTTTVRFALVPNRPAWTQSGQGRNHGVVQGGRGPRACHLRLGIQRQIRIGRAKRHTPKAAQRNRLA